MPCIILLTVVDFYQEAFLAVQIWPFCLHYISFHSCILRFFAVFTYEFMYEQHVHHKQTASLASFLASAVIKNTDKQMTNLSASFN